MRVSPVSTQDKEDRPRFEERAVPNLKPWLGIPYVAHGRTRSGCDCWGLIRLFYREHFNFDLPSYRQEAVDTDNPRSVGQWMTPITATPIWTETQTPRFGDILTFGTRTCFYHVGLFMTPELMLHTRFGTDSTVERWNGPLWQGRMQGVFRHRSFTEQVPYSSSKKSELVIEGFQDETS